MQGRPPLSFKRSLARIGLRNGYRVFPKLCPPLDGLRDEVTVADNRGVTDKWIVSLSL